MSGMTSVVILSRDGTLAPSLAAESLRRTVIAALAELAVPLVLTSSDDLPHYLARIDPGTRIVIISDTAGALSAARSSSGGRLEVVHCLLVAPTSFVGWGSFTSSWASGLRAAAADSTIYLTDSELSRAIIEEHLSSARVDVRVLSAPSVTRGSEDDSDLETMKRWSQGDQVPVFSGSTWSFEPRTLSTTEDLGRGRPDPADLSRSVETLRQVLDGPLLQREPVRIGILGHKLTFIDELARDLGSATGAVVTLDEWKNLGAPDDAKKSQMVLNRSDVIIGEWGRPNNVWIQKHAAPEKRLIVRVHRYEVTTDFPAVIDMSRFHAGVVIVPWVGRALVQRFGWPEEKIVYIPNYVNTRYFRRRKLPGSEYTLGLVGMTPDLKRLDLALDLLASLRAHDLRYTLRVRGQLPPEHIHWKTNPRISEQWGSVQFRLRTDPLLRNAVAFDAPGRDMAAWFEGVGVILSTSDLEGSHVALAEGMASGALPIARAWPGVRTLWPASCVFDEMELAVEQILRSRDVVWRQRVLDELGQHPSLDQDRVLEAWWNLLRGDRAQAQAAFGPVDWTADWYEPVDL